MKCSAFSWRSSWIRRVSFAPTAWQKVIFLLLLLHHKENQDMWIPFCCQGSLETVPFDAARPVVSPTPGGSTTTVIRVEAAKSCQIATQFFKNKKKIEGALPAKAPVMRSSRICDSERPITSATTILQPWWKDGKNDEHPAKQNTKTSVRWAWMQINKKTGIIKVSCHKVNDGRDFLWSSAFLGGFFLCSQQGWFGACLHLCQFCSHWSSLQQFPDEKSKIELRAWTVQMFISKT